MARALKPAADAGRYRVPGIWQDEYDERRAALSGEDAWRDYRLFLVEEDVTSTRHNELLAGAKARYFTEEYPVKLEELETAEFLEMYSRSMARQYRAAANLPWVDYFGDSYARLTRIYPDDAVEPFYEELADRAPLPGSGLRLSNLIRRSKCPCRRGVE